MMKKVLLVTSILILLVLQVKGQGFKIQNGNLVDANCNNFVMKGFNVPLAWYQTDVYNNMASMRTNTGANCLRLVVGNGYTPTDGSGQNWSTPDNVWQNAVQRCIDNNMVPMVEVHNILGSNNTADLQAVATWWASKSAYLTQPAVAKHVLINIANEWGDWYMSSPTNNPPQTTWRDAYIQAIQTIRNAGIKTTIVVDAPGYGQDYQASTLLNHALSVLNADPEKNVLFSLHMYCEWKVGGPSNPATLLPQLKAAGIPVIVGEFAANHPDGSATCDIDESSIINTCQAQGIGWLGWSWKGNGTGMEALDMSNDWAGTSFTSWGDRAINGANGTKTSVTSTAFTSSVSTCGTPISTSFTGTPASCVITAPHANSYFPTGNDIKINVYSTDLGGTAANGTVSRVEFYVNNSLLGQATTHTNNTFTYTWTSAPAGNHIITARAVDNSGNVSGSAGVLVVVGTTAAPERGLSACKGKYLANIVAGSVPSNYLDLWNGVTAENNCKWGVIESTRDNFNWAGADVSFNLAKNNNLMFRYHAFAWGSQFPTWAINNTTYQLLITPAEFQAEMEEYMAAVAQRYGNYIDQIDVLNEQLRTHAPATQAFKTGLGGGGTTGYDWVIWLFTKARQYFPNAKLVLNDYGLENDQSAINEQLLLIKVLRDRNLLDGFGTQAHQFNLDNLTSTQMNSSLNLMATGGVPIYVTELDLTGSGSDATQSTRYQTIFPAFWNHSAVAGITLWGYEQGKTWISDTELIRTDGTDRPAMTWLKSYVDGRTDVGYPYCTTGGTTPPTSTNILTNGEFDSGTLNWDIQNNSGANGTMTVVTNANMSGTNALRICATNAGTANWHVQVRQNAPFVAGKQYEVSFMAKADAARTMDIGIQMEGDPWTSYFGQTQNLTTVNQTFTYTFSPTVTDASAKLKFYVGNSTSCVTIDNVVFKEITPCTPPTATITTTTPTTFCQGGSVVLSANTGTGLTYQWRNGTTNIATATSSSYTATTAGSYNVIVTNASTCSATSTNTTVSVNALPTATITTTTPTTFCQGGSVVLSANTGTGLTYQWRNGTSNIASATGSSYTATAAGSYNVIVTNASNCSTTSTNTTVTVNALPTATITTTTPTTFCQGGSVVLNANTGTGLTYQWRNGTTNIATATSATYTATNAGSYNVIVTNASTCSTTSTNTTVTVNTLPAATVTAGGVTTFCQGGSVVLSANTGTGLTYQWRNGTTNIAIATSSSYTATTAGSYNVIVTNASNCSTTSTSTTVTVNALPAATVTAGGATTFCQGGSVVLSANTGTGLTYQWRNGTTNIATATGATYTATTAGSYNVIVTNASTCSATSTNTTVTVNALPTATITTSTPTTFCQGGSVVLSANTGTGLTYQWRNGTSNIATATGATYTATTVGDYNVVVTSGNCTATSTNTTVTVNTLPTATITTTTPTTFCQGGSVVLSANTGTGLTYQWRNGTSNIASATGSTYTANSSGNYNVIVSSGNCSATSTSTTVTVNAPISVSVTPNGIQTLVPSQPITLTATTSATGVTYTWYNGTSVVGSNASTLSVTTAGNYSVQITNGTCQATSNTVSVVNANAPLVSMISPTNNGTAIAPATIILEAQATDSDGSITKVEFYQNNVKVGEGTGTTSYQYTLTNVAQGAYTFYAVATDNSGLQTTSASVNFTVGVNQSPIVNTFTATYNQPTPGSSSTGSIDIAVNAQDPEGGALTVEIYDGTTLLTTLTNAPYTYTYNNPSVGTHDIVVKVKDSEGNEVTQTQSVTVLPASTPTLSANSLQVTYYPNPYREVITIEGEGTMDYIVQDMRGHEVERGTINTIGQVGANLPAAQYIVILQNQDKRSIIKIEKQ
ncbi:MAG: endo-1,4-beta-xylanase [Cytophagaceae bacterium]